MRILFVAGGTVGALAPLVAVAEQLRKTDPDTQIQFLVSGSEAELSVLENGNWTATVFQSGKLRRYFALENILDIGKVSFAFLRALSLLKKFKPDLVVSAGSFNAVPVFWAAKMLKIKTAVHQQDIQWGLANRLTARFASLVTVAYSGTFHKPNQEIVGNPVGQHIFHGDANRAREKYHLRSDVPVLFILGGSSGAKAVNDLVEKSLDQLTYFCQVVHVTGTAKMKSVEHDRYFPIQFLSSGIEDLYAAADLVVTRAGMNVLSELAVLAKPAIVIPMPKTHQTANARFFSVKNAVVALDQLQTTPESFVEAVKDLLHDDSKRNQLGKVLHSLNVSDSAHVVSSRYRAMIGS